MHNRKDNKFKTKNNQNYQKIELYGILTTKEFKKETVIQPTRRGGDRQPGWKGCAARWQLQDWVGEVAAGGLGSPTFACG